MTSVTACGENGRSTSAALSLSVVIQRAASERSPFRASTRPVPSGLVRKTASPGRAPLLTQIAVGMDRADDREAVLRLGVADRVPAGEDRAGRANLLVGSREHGADELGRKLLGKGRDREREQRRAAHGEDVVERVRRRDPAEERRVVDERREEVDREDERALVVEAIDGGVVRRVEADEEVFGLRRDEALEQLLEPRRGVLRRAAAADREARQARRLHARLL